MSHFEGLGERIVAALQTYGPLSPAALAKHCDVERPEISKALAPLIKSKSVIASGATVSRMMALPGQKLPDGEPQAPKPNRKGTTPPEAKSAQARGNGHTPNFIVALTADLGLVCVGTHDTKIFSPEETQQIATLLLANFEV